jgi:flagellar biosynthesis/type III secretory pathway chaperone
MTTSAARDHQSPLEMALLDVHATLVDLLVAADEQYAAVVAHDSERLESVTRQQERLSTRLARAEMRRAELTNGQPLETAVSGLPAPQAARASALSASIGATVRDLKQKQAEAASLIQQSIELTSQTLNFLQRLVVPQTSVYGVRGVATTTQSLIVDSRA